MVSFWCERKHPSKGLDSTSDSTVDKSLASTVSAHKIPINLNGLEPGELAHFEPCATGSMVKP